MAGQSKIAEKLGAASSQCVRKIRSPVSPVAAHALQGATLPLGLFYGGPLISGISCNADRAKSEVLINNDGGGDIPQYIAKYLYLQLSGERGQNLVRSG